MSLCISPSLLFSVSVGEEHPESARRRWATCFSCCYMKCNLMTLFVGGANTELVFNHSRCLLWRNRKWCWNYPDVPSLSLSEWSSVSFLFSLNFLLLFFLLLIIILSVLSSDVTSPSYRPWYAFILFYFCIHLYLFLFLSCFDHFNSFYL